MSDRTELLAWLCFALILLGVVSALAMPSPVRVTPVTATPDALLCGSCHVEWRGRDEGAIYAEMQRAGGGPALGEGGIPLEARC